MHSGLQLQHRNGNEHMGTHQDAGPMSMWDEAKINIEYGILESI
jgi:hypothetical protein